MRVAFQNRAVHKGTGVALVCVAAHIFLVRLVAGGKFPLQPCGEASAAAAAQAGIQHGLNDLFGRHLCQHLAQRRIAVEGDVLVDIFRVDDAAVAQRNAQLLFVKGRFVQAFDGVVFGNRLIVKKARDGAALQQVLVHNLFHVLFLYHAVKAALGVNYHNGAQRAQAKAARADDLHLILQAGGLYLGFKRLCNFIAVGRCAARAAAHHNMASVHVPLPLPQHAAAPMVNSVTGLPPMMCSATTRLTFSGVIFT